VKIASILVVWLLTSSRIREGGFWWLEGVLRWVLGGSVLSDLVAF
jgi:hypothetical protein